MPSDDVNPLRLDPRAVEEYFRLGASTAFVLLQSPQVIMRIDPTNEAIELMLPARGADPKVTDFERLDIRRFMQDHNEWFKLVIDASQMHYEAYSLVESIVDQIGSGASFRHAVSEALFNFKELLIRRRKLTEEKEIGLIGELLVLRHAIEKVGEENALTAWLGPLAEEHDFAFVDYDAEVKTTKSESRIHLIGSETQLEPSPGRPLFLISIQVTLAGGAATGFTLPSLISEIEQCLNTGLRAFLMSLERLGWNKEDSDLYQRRYQLRTAPSAYSVDELFPAITPRRLDRVVPKRANILGVNYRVNVSDLECATVGFPLHEFCEVPE